MKSNIEDDDNKSIAEVMEEVMREVKKQEACYDACQDWYKAKTNTVEFLNTIAEILKEEE